MSDLSDFFVVGGTLRAQAPSYITRPADQELFDRVLAGDFCYVLTSRQMGKSSLMVRTTRRLNDAQVATVIIDLTSIGTMPIDQWYIGVLTRIKADLRLDTDIETWWNERRAMGAPQRFIEFLHSIVLAQILIPVVIFIDEIDSTLNLDFRDDFFAAIRAVYNARAGDHSYDRLTFVLLGVATPTDLIQDRLRTPFNIGRRILLREFDEDDTLPLKQGLENAHPESGKAILARIFYWTNGHPYLTQKLCLAAVQSQRLEWSDQHVDALVETSFFSKEARKDSNLIFVENWVRSSAPAERRRMLKLYRDVYAERKVPADDRSTTQNHLELSGLIGVERGKLHARNRIYRRVFDTDWIKANTPRNRQLSIAVAASLVTILLVAFIVYRVINPSTQTGLQVEVCIDNFKKNTSATVRFEALNCLFDRPGYSEEALRLFYDLSPSDQKYLFLSANEQIGDQVVKVVKGIYGTLDDEMPNDRDLMDAMIAALHASRQPQVDQLIQQLGTWKKGRELAEIGDYTAAVRAYSAAMDPNNDQPALRYDRAVAYRQLGMYDESIADLDAVVRLAGTSVATNKPPAASASAPRFASASATVGAVRVAVQGDERLQTALQKHQAEYSALADAAIDVLQALQVTQTARVEATQAALAQAATGTASAATMIASIPTQPPPPLPTTTPVLPTATPVLPTATPVLPTATPVLPTATPWRDLPISISQLTTVSLDALFQNPPTGEQNWGGVTFMIPETNNKLGTKCVEGDNAPNAFVIPVDNVAHPETIYILINAGYTPGFYNERIGVIDVKFDDGNFFSHDLILGYNIREWRILAENAVSTTSSPGMIEVYRGANVYSEIGVLDMLKIDIPFEDRNRRLNAIEIRDLSVETVGSQKPCLIVAGATVRARG
jgi:tetratricopeptide (TPR) repeat protein